MTRPGFILVLFAVLGLGLFLVLSPEDVVETAYDESELLPYESTPEAANLIAQVSGSVTQRVPDATASSTRSRPALTHSPHPQTPMAQPETRAALASLCLLLC